VHHADGLSTLVYFRFRDALAEVEALDGSRVHRGAWLADASVAAARRSDRRWIVELTNGATVPVSAQYVAELRRRGWHRRSAPASKR
jgi:DNA-binding LytR/AlgR family response regulator